MLCVVPTHPCMTAACAFPTTCVLPLCASQTAGQLPLLPPSHFKRLIYAPYICAMLHTPSTCCKKNRHELPKSSHLPPPTLLHCPLPHPPCPHPLPTTTLPHLPPPPHTTTHTPNHYLSQRASKPTPHFGSLLPQRHTPLPCLLP